MDCSVTDSDNIAPWVTAKVWAQIMPLSSGLLQNAGYHLREHINLKSLLNAYVSFLQHCGQCIPLLTSPYPVAFNRCGVQHDFNLCCSLSLSLSLSHTHTHTRTVARERLSLSLSLLRGIFTRERLLYDQSVFVPKRLYHRWGGSHITRLGYNSKFGMTHL
jgi:hypothetical protein